MTEPRIAATPASRPAGAGSAARRRVLLATALVTVSGAVAHAWWWLAGPEAVTAGQPLGVVIEGVLSDAAKGACAGLIGGLAVFVTGWWIRRAVTATRPRGSGVDSMGDDATRVGTSA
ncbi:hypothetical protein [Kitasatospora sp. NPDC058190]|uniref:hypothetical protein n=1 Tax=Kitasatospora sp. NPDC058190 TaxID=3346371 RepID=UPI0036DC06E0